MDFEIFWKMPGLPRGMTLRAGDCSIVPAFRSVIIGTEGRGKQTQATPSSWENIQ
jgi:hypothetical protein